MFDYLRVAIILPTLEPMYVHVSYEKNGQEAVSMGGCPRPICHQHFGHFNTNELGSNYQITNGLTNHFVRGILQHV